MLRQRAQRRQCLAGLCPIATPPTVTALPCFSIPPFNLRVNNLLYTNGPAGGGAARKYVTEVIGIVSALLPRSEVSSNVTVLESEPHYETV